jgi:hypothetical protein
MGWWIVSVCVCLSLSVTEYVLGVFSLSLLLSLGSMIPFTLLVIRAQLPYLLKASNSLDPLFELLAVCR